jgi:anti-anti-sigma factor
MSMDSDGPEFEMAYPSRSRAGMAFVPVEGALQAPVCRELRDKVEALLRRGQRSLVIDLTRVSDLDAAGIGELVHLYGRARAADATLRIVHAGKHVCRLLHKAGLVEILSAESCCEEGCA